MKLDKEIISGAFQTIFTPRGLYIFKSGYEIIMTELGKGEFKKGIIKNEEILKTDEEIGEHRIRNIITELDNINFLKIKDTFRSFISMPEGEKVIYHFRDGIYFGDQLFAKKFSGKFKAKDAYCYIGNFTFPRKFLKVVNLVGELVVDNYPYLVLKSPSFIAFIVGKKASLDQIKLGKPDRIGLLKILQNTVDVYYSAGLFYSAHTRKLVGVSDIELGDVSRLLFGVVKPGEYLIECDDKLCAHRTQDKFYFMIK